MVPKVKWSDPALDDLREIRKHIGRDSEGTAALFVGMLLDAAEKTAEFPFAGRVVPEFENPKIRESLVGLYRIVYRVKRGSIHILRVSHTARMLKL